MCLRDFTGFLKYQVSDLPESEDFLFHLVGRSLWTDETLFQTEPIQFT